MDEDHGADVERQIEQWRSYLRRRRAIRAQDIDELESHLRDQIREFISRGLEPDEAFLISVKRLGSLDALSMEFAREHSDRLWKQLVRSSDSQDEVSPWANRELFVVVAFAVAAALAIKVPELFGVRLQGNAGFYLRNVSLFVLPFLAGYFVWKRQWNRSIRWLAAPFVLGAMFANIYPCSPGGSTEVLTGLHLPIALWFVIGLTYVAGDWRSSPRRMDFVRFSGEVFIYYVLIALGGGVLTGFTIAMFGFIGQDMEWAAQGWLLPCGAVGAVIVASWLVEAKQSVVENMAPVLTRVFTPLFTLLLLTFLGTIAWTGTGINVEREVLIGFDLLLALVLGLVLYAVSARDPDTGPEAFDVLMLVLVVSALIVDVLALAAITGRISEFGFTPNRVAALGENIILFVNLSWSAWLSFLFIRRKTPFRALERWQMAYLPVYPIWAALVVIVFPPVFGFR